MRKVFGLFSRFSMTAGFWTTAAGIVTAHWASVELGGPIVGLGCAAFLASMLTAVAADA